MKTLGGRNAEGHGQMGLIILPPFAGLPGKMGKDVQVILTTDPGILGHGVFDKDELVAYLAEMMPDLGIGQGRPTPWRMAMVESPPMGQTVVVKTEDGMVTSGKLVSLEDQRWELDEGFFIFTQGVGDREDRKVAAWTPL